MIVFWTGWCYIYLFIEWSPVCIVNLSFNARAIRI